MSRSIPRAGASSTCHAQTRSREGSAGPNHPPYRTLVRRPAKASPHRTQRRCIHPVSDVPQARLDPLVVIGQIPASSTPSEYAAARWRRARRTDEPSQVSGKGARDRKADRGHDLAIDPGLHRPRHRIAGARAAQCDGRGRRERLTVANSALAAASCLSSTSAAEASCACSGSRAHIESPTRKIAFTVPLPVTVVTASSLHCGY